MEGTVELVMCKRNLDGEKTSRRERIRTNVGNAGWLAERFEREALKGLRGRKRLVASLELFGAGDEDEDEDEA